MVKLLFWAESSLAIGFQGQYWTKNCALWYTWYKIISKLSKWKMKALCWTVTKCDKQTPCLLGLGIICKWQNCKIIYENFANGKIWKHFSHKNRVKCDRIWNHYCNPWKIGQSVRLKVTGEKRWRKKKIPVSLHEWKYPATKNDITESTSPAWIWLGWALTTE